MKEMINIRINKRDHIDMKAVNTRLSQRSLESYNIFNDMMLLIMF